MSEKKNIFFRILAMVLFVVSVQKLIRSIISGAKGLGYTFAEFGLSNATMFTITIVLLLISLYLFNITDSISTKEEK